MMHQLKGQKWNIDILPFYWLKKIKQKLAKNYGLVLRMGEDDDLSFEKEIFPEDDDFVDGKRQKGNVFSERIIVFWEAICCFEGDVRSNRNPIFRHHRYILSVIIQ